MTARRTHWIVTLEADASGYTRKAVPVDVDRLSRIITGRRSLEPWEILVWCNEDQVLHLLDVLEAAGRELERAAGRVRP